ncbi:UDP-glucose/GDP-mannose dehydrogenase family protein [Candidatus Peregrinibacteria bacterium]|nr:UDP-glucose/GDP-mannose dehydrogenase family protein [Candidatus Peregrinibacteria bacterium]
MKITVIGTGYVGLVTGACFAEMGHNVICVDIDKEKVEWLKKGIIPIYEPGLGEMVKKNLRQNRLSFSTNQKNAIEFADVVFSSVGTPSLKNGDVDLHYVEESARSFGKCINSYKIFVNKSTVPVGTGDLCKKIIKMELKKRKKNFDFDAVSNPEFLREGSAIKDTFSPDRIVIGKETNRAKELMYKLYKTLEENGTEIIFTDLRTAEIIKYTSNCFLATKISFINEIANFCSKAGGNIKTIAKGIGLDKRIGKYFLNAGIGYGGSCFPKDIKGLIGTGKKFKHEFEIIKAVDKVNEGQKEILYHKLKCNFKSLKNKKIAIWGLAFKPGTDDMREAPSITIIKKLSREDAIIQAYDPVAENTAKKIFKTIPVIYCRDAYLACKNADALLVVTEWDEFKSLDFAKVKSLMKGNLILDGRNLFEKETVESFGLRYEGI